MAEDGGLYYPVSIPSLAKSELASFQGGSYLDIAFQVIRLFLKEAIPDDDLKKVIQNAYARQSFEEEDKAHLKKITNDFYLLELFHGPTLAFKDFALQFLANLMNYFLAREAKKMIILGATSGDTGSASIQAFKNVPAAKVFILHPHEKITLKQRKQMTTESAANVFNIALKGDFDDCQNLVKNIFKNHPTLKDHQLVSINSINFARIIPQIVYYFYAFSRIKNNEAGVNFVVPTGNFGNIFAGYLAKKMGLPVKKLVIATNENDVLHAFMTKNEYLKKKLKKTFSPSMDIVISSNFERLLFDVYQRDSEAISKIMQDLDAKKRFEITKSQFEKLSELFASLTTTNQETLNIIKWFHEKHAVVIDPHTATAVKWLYERENAPSSNDLWEPLLRSAFPTVALATAHPAKFDEVYQLLKGNTKREISFKDPLAKIMAKKEKFSLLEKSTEGVIDFIESNL